MRLVKIGRRSIHLSCHFAYVLHLTMPACPAHAFLKVSSHMMALCLSEVKRNMPSPAKPSVDAEAEAVAMDDNKERAPPASHSKRGQKGTSQGRGAGSKKAASKHKSEQSRRSKGGPKRAVTEACYNETPLAEPGAP